jgi:hypothetical protein
MAIAPDQRSRMCSSKNSYVRLKDARTMKNYRERRGSGKLRIYKCPLCPSYHLTSAVNRRGA